LIKLGNVHSILLELLLKIFYSSIRQLHLLLILDLLIKLLGCHWSWVEVLITRSVYSWFGFLILLLRLIQSRIVIWKILIDFVALNALPCVAVSTCIIGFINLPLCTICIIFHQLISQVYQHIFWSLRIWSISAHCTSRWQSHYILIPSKASLAVSWCHWIWIILLLYH